MERLKRLLEVVRAFCRPSELDDFWHVFNSEYTKAQRAIANADAGEANARRLQEQAISMIIAPSQPLMDTLQPPAIAKQVIQSISFRGHPKSFIYNAYVRYFQEHPEAPGDAPNKHLGLRLAASVAYCLKKGKRHIGLESLNQTLAVILLRHCAAETAAPKKRLRDLIAETIPDLKIPDSLFPATQVRLAKQQGHRREKDHGPLDPIVSAFQDVLQSINKILNKGKAEGMDSGAEGGSDGEEKAMGVASERGDRSGSEASDGHTSESSTHGSTTPREEFRKLLKDLGLLYQLSNGDDSQTFDQLLESEETWRSAIARTEENNLQQLVVTALLKLPIQEVIGRLDPSDYEGLKSEVGRTAHCVQAVDIAGSAGLAVTTGVAGAIYAWNRMHPPVTPAPYVPPAPTPYLENCVQRLNVTAPTGDSNSSTTTLVGILKTGEVTQFSTYPLLPDAVWSTQDAPATIEDPDWHCVPDTDCYYWRYTGSKMEGGTILATEVQPGDTITFKSPGVDGSTTCDPINKPVPASNEAVSEVKESGGIRMLTGSAGATATAAAGVTLPAAAGAVAVVVTAAVAMYEVGCLIQWSRGLPVETPSIAVKTAEMITGTFKQVREWWKGSSPAAVEAKTALTFGSQSGDAVIEMGHPSPSGSGK